MHWHLLVLIFCMSGLAASGQITPQKSGSWACGDDKFLSIQKGALPDYEQMLKKHNLQLQEYLSRSMSDKTLKLPDAHNRISDPQDGNLTIPVVIHVVYPAGEAYGSGTNISYAQIRSQMEALNAAFNKGYAAYNGQSHPNYAQNTHIRFCLARTASAGNGT